MGLNGLSICCRSGFDQSAHCQSMLRLLVESLLSLDVASEAKPMLDKNRNRIADARWGGAVDACLLCQFIEYSQRFVAISSDRRRIGQGQITDGFLRGRVMDLDDCSKRGVLSNRYTVFSVVCAC